MQLDASSGAPTGLPAFGDSGNALGITPAPITGNLVYVASDGTILTAPVGGLSATFSTVTTGNFVDGIFFDPTGNFLLLAGRVPTFRLTILDRTGALVQHVLMTSEPDGISFHSTSPKFVVTNNIDGTMIRFDFPGDDFTQVPAQSTFASGGFRGNLSQVGADGCVYVTQFGTRYDDGSKTGENSLARICGGFAPPPGVAVGDNNPPVCSFPAGASDRGTTTDNRPSEDTDGNGVLAPEEDLNDNGQIDEDTGIVSVVLDPGSTNLGIRRYVQHEMYRGIVHRDYFIYMVDMCWDEDKALGLVDQKLMKMYRLIESKSYKGLRTYTFAIE